MANLSLIDKNGKDIIEPIMWFGGDSLPVFSAEKTFFSGDAKGSIVFSCNRMISRQSSRDSN